MKTQLRRGGRADLNVYTVGYDSVTPCVYIVLTCFRFKDTFAGLLGYATFPQSYAANPSDDGIVILYSSLPTGSTPGYGQGKTAVHETGHWFGLYHTFQGSCIQPGDYVEDTPPEGIPSEGCLSGRVTCPVEDVVGGFADPIGKSPSV